MCRCGIVEGCGGRVGGDWLSVSSRRRFHRGAEVVEELLFLVDEYRVRVLGLRGEGEMGMDGVGAEEMR